MPRRGGTLRFIVSVALLVVAIAVVGGVASIPTNSGHSTVSRPLGTSSFPVSFGRRVTSAVSPSATTDAISITGYDPTTVALSWAQSGDFCFNSYSIQYATYSSGGPWTTMDTITSAATTALYVSGWTPGETVWFQDIDNSGCGGGSATSNVVQQTFPNWPTLTYSDVASSTVALTWTNTASYGGLMGFWSYQVEESINSGSYSVINTITSESTTTYDVTGVTGLNTGTVYSFYVFTTDYCNGCSQSESYTAVYASTNSVTHLAVDQPTAAPASVEVGQTTQLSIVALGGTTPYSYSWTGLPAGCSPSDVDPLTCSPTSAGTSSVTVTVTDSRGITLTSLPVTVTVVQGLAVGAPTASPSSVAVGGTIQLSVAPSGGATPYSYAWNGLPSGCHSADSAQLTCSPSVAGYWNVTVTVTDANGISHTSSPVEVSATTSSSGGGGSGSSSPGSSLSSTDWALIAVVIVVVAAVGVVLAVRRKPKAPGSPTEYQPPAAQQPPPPSPPNG